MDNTHHYHTPHIKRQWLHKLFIDTRAIREFMYEVKNIGCAKIRMAQFDLQYPII